MKIKIKRYKEIEQIALAEAVANIIQEQEIMPNDPKLTQLARTLKSVGLQPGEINKVMLQIGTNLNA